MRLDGINFADTLDGDGDLRVTGDTLSIAHYLNREEMTRLRDHLTRLLGDAPTPAPAAPLEIVVGREYRLLPGARHAVMSGEIWEDAGVTRVVVLSGPDPDGDYKVRALDGCAAYDTAFVMPRYLAPLDPQPATPDAVKAAREVAAEMRTGGLYVQARAFEMFAAKLEGKSE